MARLTVSGHEEGGAKFAEYRRKQAQAEGTILSALAEDHPEFTYNQVYGGALYSSLGSIKVGDEFRSGGVEDCATWAEVGALLAEFPPVPLILFRDGCVGVRPESDDVEREGSERTDIEPFTIRVQNSPHTAPVAEVVWYSDLRPGVRVRFEVILKPEFHPARMLVETKRDRSTGTLLSCKRVGFTPAAWFAQASAESMRINYGGGGPTDPGSVMIYWERDDRSATPSEFWLSLYSA